jgi:hypothetical protein
VTSGSASTSVHRRRTSSAGYANSSEHRSERDHVRGPFQFDQGVCVGLGGRPERGQLVDPPGDVGGLFVHHPVVVGPVHHEVTVRE